MRPSPVPSRRAVIVGLSGATAAVLADLAFGLRGHEHGAPKDGGTPTAAPPTDPAWRSAADDEQSLIDAYETATRAHPALAATLALPLAHHRVHLAALTRTSGASTAVLPTTTASGAAADAGTATEHRDTLRALMAREDTAAGHRTAAAVEDQGGGQLLARIAASEAVHADYLGMAINAIKPPVPSSISPSRLATFKRPTPTSTSTPPPPQPTTR